MAKVNEVLTKVEQVGICNVDPTDLKFIPLHYFATRVQSYQLYKMFSSLPISYQDALKNKLPCFEHYELMNCTDHFDGPIPSKERCRLCIKKSLL